MNYGRSPLRKNPTSQTYVMMMNETLSTENGINGTQGASPGRVSGEEQPAPGRNPATAKLRWTKEENKLVMRCYIKSDPSKRGYRKRMMAIWREEGVFETTEQRLADQARAITTNAWLSVIEIEELKMNIASRDAEHGDVEENEDISPQIRAETSDITAQHDSNREHQFVKERMP